jgi:hypothetical protein
MNVSYVGADDMRTQSETGTQEIIDSAGRPLVQVPFWAWQDKITSMVSILNKHPSENPAKFQWPLIKEDLTQERLAHRTSDSR